MRNRINGEITAPEVRLVVSDEIAAALRSLGLNTQDGVMSRDAAQQKARALKLDLVEVSPNANPPVVRIMDRGKLSYEEKKTRKKQKVQKLKEIKLRPVTDEGDYQVKLRNLLGFLDHGDKVKVTVRFKGREITHKELGSHLLDRLKNEVKEFGVIDQEPKLEGKQMVMMISPKPKKGIATKVTDNAESK